MAYIHQGIQGQLNDGWRFLKSLITLKIWSLHAYVCSAGIFSTSNLSFKVIKWSRYFGPLTFLQCQIRSNFHKILLVTYWQHLGNSTAIWGLKISKIIYIHIWHFSFWPNFCIVHLWFSFKLTQNVLFLLHYIFFKKI